MSEAVVKMPQKMLELFQGDYRYRVAYGGRGSGKTRTFAMMVAWMGYRMAKEGRRGQILCGREHLNSLEESSFTEIKGAIESDPVLNDFYTCGARFIRTKCGAIDFSFSGLRLNVSSVKSKSRILLVWIDEAEEVSELAWRTLLPTVREEGSEIYVSFNPKDEESPTYKRFVEDPPPNAIVRKVNWSDNPYFPQVLKDELELDRKRLKPEVFAHVWEGACLPYQEGSYYRSELLQAENEGRLMDNIHYDRQIPVITAWDLGINDSTSIVFAQHVGSEIRVIDYYENSGKALDHYVQMMRDKAHEHGYLYGCAVLPHDARVRELGSGKSRLEILDGLGLRDTSVTPQLRVDDGIAAVRLALSRCYFDMGKTKELVRCLRNYHNEYDEKARTFKSKPAHDWSSHAADAFRYLITGYKDTTSWGSTDVRRGSERYVA
jgi:phage terminase large subunit